MQQHGSKYFARTPPPTLGLHINRDHQCSNMVVNTLPADTDRPPDPKGGVKRSNSTYQNMVMLLIKLKGIANAAT